MFPLTDILLQGLPTLIIRHQMKIIQRTDDQLNLLRRRQFRGFENFQDDHQEILVEFHPGCIDIFIEECRQIAELK